MQRKRIPAAERRALILGAARREFARRGYAGARLDDIAAAAGVTKPILYRHFESKQALYIALLAKHEEDLPSFVTGLDPAPSPEALLRAILDVWFDYVRANSDSWLLLFRDASGGDQIQARRTQVNVRAREVLASFISAAGGVPASQVEPTAELMSRGLAGLVLWWIDNPGYDKRELVELAARMCAPALEPG